MSLILAANFIAEKRFEFLGNYFPEVDVQAKLDDVETNYFPDPTIELWGSSRPEGVKLMTAHLLKSGVELDRAKRNVGVICSIPILGRKPNSRAPVG